ncbi:MAG: CheR family methyltransferase [Myxococcota bacterium]
MANTEDLDDRDFNRARELIRRFAGISLADSKKALVHGRLASRVRSLGITTAAYLQKVEDDAAEREQFINALTTNVTDFFREKHHFEALRQHLVPRLLRSRPSRRLRIWSAGCSSGEEPYTIAMTLRSCEIPAGWDVKILATDLDSNILARAASGIYPLARVEPVPEAERRRFFLLGKGEQAGQARVADELRSLVTFRQLNLMEPWPFKGPMDVIFCRNVMIYFDDATRRRLVDRFVQMLAPDGVLMLGHSESLMGAHPQLTSAGRTIFEKQAHAQRQAA